MEVSMSTFTSSVAYVTGLPQQQPHSNACALHVLVNMKTVLSTTSLHSFTAYPTWREAEVLRKHLITLFAAQVDERNGAASDQNREMNPSSAPSTHEAMEKNQPSTPNCSYEAITPPSSPSASVATSCGNLTPQCHIEVNSPAFNIGPEREEDYQHFFYRKNGTELILSQEYATATTMQTHMAQTTPNNMSRSRSYNSTKRKQRPEKHLLSQKLVKLMSKEHIQKTISKTKCGCRKKCLSMFNGDDVATLRRFVTTSSYIKV